MYLGNTLQAAYSSYLLIDSLSASFNGTTTSFALKVNGVAPVPFPLNEQNVLISVGGVPQKPDPTGAEGFKFSGTNIVFSSAPKTGEAFWGVVLAGADYVNVGVSYPDGAAATPSITFNSNKTTGIYLSGVSTLGFTTAGVLRSTIDSNGNLSILSAGSATIPAVAVGTGTTYAPGIYSPGADQVAISTSGTGRVFVSSAGLVGIGTTSPGKTLTLNMAPDTTSTTNGMDVSNNSPGLTVAQINSTTIGMGTTGLLNNFSGDTHIRSFWGFSIDKGGGNLSSGASNTVNADSRTFAIRQYAGGTTWNTQFCVNSSGNVGIGTTDVRQKLTFGSLTPSSTATPDCIDLGATYTSTSASTNLKIKLYVDSGGNIYGFTANGSGELEYYAGSSAAPGKHVFLTGGTEKARIDASGRLLVGTSTPVASDSSILQVAGGDSARPRFHRNINDIYESAIRLSKARGTGFEIVSNNDDVAVISFQGADGSALRECASIKASIDNTPGTGSMPGRLVFSTTPSGSATPTERMRIGSGGWVSISNTAAEGTETFGVYKSGTYSIASFLVTAGGANTSSLPAIIVGRNGATTRSINAGGTVNASGADYAEYMFKAGNFTIAKGDICAVTIDGELTNIFADAVSFLVKSTNPSYVGGDTWGTEDIIGSKPDAKDLDALAQWQAKAETERQKVDRIAFAGQVPVNVTGATPGQYIVPLATEDGGITGIAKDEANLTLAEYMRAVGKVIAIENDGRARIIVKVA